MGVDSMTGFDAKREAALDKLVQEQERLGLYDPAPQPAQEAVKWSMPQGWWIVESTPDALNMWPTSKDILLDKTLAQPAQEPRQWIWLSDADIRETIDSICQYNGDYDEWLCKKIERKIKELNT